MSPRTISAATTLVAALSAAPTYAIETGCGYSATQISAVMQAEHQKPLITANRKGSGEVANTINLFVANKDGEGYFVSEEAVGSGKFCINAKLKNVSLFDVSKPGLPKEALIGGKLNEVLQNGFNNGKMVYLQAFATENGQTGSYITVNGNPADKSGTLYAATSPTEVALRRGFTNISYSKEALALMGKQ